MLFNTFPLKVVSVARGSIDIVVVLPMSTNLTPILGWINDPELRQPGRGGLTVVCEISPLGKSRCRLY